MLIIKIWRHVPILYINVKIYVITNWLCHMLCSIDNRMQNDLQHQVEVLCYMLFGFHRIVDDLLIPCGYIKSNMLCLEILIFVTGPRKYQSSLHVEIFISVLTCTGNASSTCHHCIYSKL